MLRPYIAKAVNYQNLTLEEAREAMTIVMTGRASLAQIGGYLVALSMKGETVEEITGSAQAMREVGSRVNLNANGDILIDTAGTGGDGSYSFNISTAAAFVIAGAGSRVAKHGNRAASSRCGSADVLAALGVNLELTPDQVAICIEEIGIGFMFAPKFHPAMKHAIGPRRELGQRTIFNILGPLTNPAGATHQLIGVFDPDLTHTLAQVLGELGGQAAFVVHGHGGLDELTTSGPNKISHLADGEVCTYDFNPSGLGLRHATHNDLLGGSPEENANRMRMVLSGKDQSPLKDVVILNAAAALSVENGDLTSGLDQAEESLASGAALDKMRGLIEISQSIA